MAAFHRFLLLCALLGLCGASKRLVEREISLLGRSAADALQELRSTSSGVAASGDEVPIVDPPKHTAGYFKLSGTKDSHLFYFFFQSRENSDSSPLVLWTNGGPGCSSELAVFFEQGPYKIEDDLTLSLREHGWDTSSNMIFVDQPVGTGFSYTSFIGDHRHISRKGVGQDILEFMREFYKAHPDMADRDFYVTGESYAGHYVPGIAHVINDANKAGEEPQIPLAGIGIGNGLTNPKIQYDAYSDYALLNKLISKSLHDEMKSASGTCGFMIDLCGSLSFFCYMAIGICQNTQFQPILTSNQGLNYYDIRVPCKGQLCYDFSSMSEYLNQEEIKKQLGVKKDWEECKRSVYMEMLGDWMLNYQDDVAVLLQDGIRVLIYAGDKDLICNWLGNRRWVDTLQWEGADEWKDGKDFVWKVDGEEAGMVKETEAKDLVFVRVYDAGHMVPMDQPAHSLDMINRFLRKESFKDVEPANTLEDFVAESIAVIAVQ